MYNFFYAIKARCLIIHKSDVQELLFLEENAIKKNIWRKKLCGSLAGIRHKIFLRACQRTFKETGKPHTNKTDDIQFKIF